jgi:hypothetical protein
MKSPIALGSVVLEIARPRYAPNSSSVRGSRKCAVLAAARLE